MYTWFFSNIQYVFTYIFYLSTYIIKYIEILINFFQQRYLIFYNNRIIDTYYFNNDGKKIKIYNSIGFIKKYNHLQGKKLLFEIKFIHNNEICRYYTKNIKNIHPLQVSKMITYSEFKNKYTLMKQIEYVELNDQEISNTFKKIAYCFKLEKFNVNDVYKIYRNIINRNNISINKKNTNNVLKIINDELDEITFKDSEQIDI